MHAAVLSLLFQRWNADEDFRTPPAGVVDRFFFFEFFRTSDEYFSWKGSSKRPNTRRTRRWPLPPPPYLVPYTEEVPRSPHFPLRTYRDYFARSLVLRTRIMIFSILNSWQYSFFFDFFRVLRVIIDTLIVLRYIGENVLPEFPARNLVGVPVVFPSIYQWEAVMTACIGQPSIVEI